MADGSVGILNVGAGDTKLSFDPNNPAEVIRASRIVKDMIRRGYALLVQVGTAEDGAPKYQRAKDFDEKTAEYVIADFDPIIAEREDANEAQASTENFDQEKTPQTQHVPDDAVSLGGGKTPSRRGKKDKRIPASSTSAVAVSRTAGG